MSNTITIDPITRIEGHLGISVEMESGKVSKAFSYGEMFRGFEMILKGRDPMDAQQITQRICGVCPISHGTASIRAQDMAYGAKPPLNGRVIRNLILGANYIQSHIIHFYHLSALDFVDIAAVTKYQGKDPALNELKAWVTSQLSSDLIYPAAPFLPRYSAEYIANTELNITAIKHYLDALNMRRLAQKAASLFAGKLPHAAALIPGGVTEKVTAKKIAAFKSILNVLQKFINHSYLPDVVEVASAFPDYFRMGGGCKNFMAYGVFPEKDDDSAMFLPSGILMKGELDSFDSAKIAEDIKYSRYSSPSGLGPDKGETSPEPHKNGAYSWLKAPRYDGNVVEVGPLARMMISHKKGDNQNVKKQVDALLARIDGTSENLISVMGRHAARAVECKIVADRCLEWLEQLNPKESSFKDFEIPEYGNGVGLTEAPRGALGHWLAIKNRKIDNYQCVVPTTWNCSPRDDRGVPGAVEQALKGTSVSDSNNPIEPARVVRSFDPCIACAVH